MLEDSHKDAIKIKAVCDGTFRRFPSFVCSLIRISSRVHPEDPGCVRRKGHEHGRCKGRTPRLHWREFYTWQSIFDHISKFLPYPRYRTPTTKPAPPRLLLNMRQASIPWEQMLTAIRRRSNKLSGRPSRTPKTRYQSWPRELKIFKHKLRNSRPMYVLLHVLELYFSQCSDWSLHKRNCRCHRGWCYICIVLFHSFCWCCCRCKCIQRNFFRFSVSRRPHRLPYLLLPVPELPKVSRRTKWKVSVFQYATKWR